MQLKKIQTNRCTLMILVEETGFPALQRLVHVLPVRMMYAYHLAIALWNAEYIFDSNLHKSS